MHVPWMKMKMANKTWKSCNSLYANMCKYVDQCASSEVRLVTLPGSMVTLLSRCCHASWQCSAAALVSVKWKLLRRLTSRCVSCVCVSAAQCAVNSDACPCQQCSLLLLDSVTSGPRHCSGVVGKGLIRSFPNVVERLGTSLVFGN